MSKIALILDKPESCDKCPASRYYSREETLFCECRVCGLNFIIHEDKQHKVDVDNRDAKVPIPDWCPARLVPEKATLENSNMSIMKILGWNACIDALTGEDNREFKI